MVISWIKCVGVKYSKTMVGTLSSNIVIQKLVQEFPLPSTVLCSHIHFSYITVGQLTE